MGSVMPDQDGKLDPRRAVRWADHVTSEHQHSPADLENVLLANDRWNLSRLKHKVRGRYRAAFLGQMYIAFCGAPLVVFLVFTSGRWWGTTHTYSASWAYPVAAAAAILGVLVLAVFFLRWFTQRVRLRGRLAPTFCVLYVIAGGFGLFRAYNLAPSFDGDILPYVIPMWAFFLLSVATLVYQFRSAYNPAWDHIIDKRKWRLDVRRIHPEDQAWMLQEREYAVRIMIERGFWDGMTAEDLVTRPLGELHLPTPEVVKHG